MERPGKTRRRAAPGRFAGQTDRPGSLDEEPGRDMTVTMLVRLQRPSRNASDDERVERSAADGKGENEGDSLFADTHDLQFPCSVVAGSPVDRGEERMIARACA